MMQNHAFYQICKLNMTPKPLKSNVMLFFSLFILTRVNSNRNLPKKEVGEKRAIVQALQALKD